MPPPTDQLVEHTITIKLPPNQARPAWEVALLFPAQGTWTQEEYLALTDLQITWLSTPKGRLRCYQYQPRSTSAFWSLSF